MGLFPSLAAIKQWASLKEWMYSYYILIATNGITTTLLTVLILYIDCLLQQKVCAQLYYLNARFYYLASLVTWWSLGISFSCRTLALRLRYDASYSYHIISPIRIQLIKLNNKLK